MQAVHGSKVKSIMALHELFGDHGCSHSYGERLVLAYNETTVVRLAVVILSSAPAFSVVALS